MVEVMVTFTIACVLISNAIFLSMFIERTID